MSKFWNFFAIAFIFQSALCESELEREAMQQLNMLEDQVYQPIGLYQSILTEQFKTISANFTDYRDEANNFVDSFAQSITADIEEVLGNFKNYSIDTTNCDENVQESIDQLAESSVNDIQDIVLKGITEGQNIISEMKQVFMVAQNKTIAIRLEVQNCLTMVDDSECLLAALDTILFMRQTISKIMTSAGLQHEAQLGLLEDNLVADLEKLVVQVVDDYVDILDGLLICTLQYYMME